MPKRQVTAGGENLAFFREFINVNGAPLQKIADEMGITKASIFNWFRSDDVRLQQIIRTAEILGYSLYAIISDNPDARAHQLYTDGDAVTYNQKRLHFLTSAIKEAGMTKTELAQRLGMTRETITYWYIKDDITIKNLLNCIRVIGSDLNFKFVRNVPNSVPDRKKICVRSKIVSFNEWYYSNEVDKRKVGESEG